MISPLRLFGRQNFSTGTCVPGLALGIRAAEIALREIGPHAQDEEVVAVVETDMCGVDAIQVLTGCTFGKGNLIHKDYGKKHSVFIVGQTGKESALSRCRKPCLLLILNVTSW